MEWDSFFFLSHLLGEFKEGEKINADVNGSYQIMKKVFPNVFDNGIVGAGSHPLVVNIPL